MTSASAVFARALDRLLADDLDGYVATFAPDGVIEWPFAPSDWPHRRAEGRAQIRAVVGANLARSRAAGRHLVALHDVVEHPGRDPHDLVVELHVELRDADGSSTRLPYVHIYRVTDDGHIASLRDYFGAPTARLARSGEAALSAEDRLAIHELLALHGHLTDDRRGEDLERFLTPDAVYDLEAYGLGTVVGLDALRALFEQRPGDQPIGHHVTNVIVTPGPDGRAHARSKGLAVLAGGRAGTCIYDDELVRTPAGWRLARRKVIAPGA